MKRTVFDVIQPASRGNIASKIFDLFIMALIFIGIASVFIMTFDISKETAHLLNELEKAAIIVFSAEYLLRIWTANMLYPELSPARARLKYILSGMAIIDLVAILPFYLPMLLPVNLVGIRAIRLVRLLRVFKLNRYSEALVSIGEVFKKKYREILVSMFFVFILLVVASLLIYYAEHDAQPDKFPNAFSGLWWAVATLTTVGYGDIYPVTAIGRLLGAVIAVMGIGMVAVPTSILSSGFMELLSQKSGDPGDGEEKEKPSYCPHCGKKL
ncbi:MAG: ion transporter [Lentisphaeria bacterium]|nr:ion transporter [Lentisphaeria bacterium]